MPIEFRSIPETVQAVQFDGTNDTANDIFSFVSKVLFWPQTQKSGSTLRVLDGMGLGREVVRLEVGDWICMKPSKRPVSADLFVLSDSDFRARFIAVTGEDGEKADGEIILHIREGLDLLTAAKAAVELLENDLGAVVSLKKAIAAHEGKGSA